MREADIHRLVLWNVDLTLVDVAKVTRAAYAQAFREVTGRPLVQLPQMAGRTEPEAFFDAVALNGIDMSGSERLLAPFSVALAAAMQARQEELASAGGTLPGAAEALAAVGAVDGVVQAVLTGSSRPNAVLKLRAFGLDRHLDESIGGYAGSDPYPKGTLIQVARQRAAEKYGASFAATAYIADAAADVAAAKIGEARSVAVASGRATTGELREAGADVVLADLTDAEAVVRAIIGPVGGGGQNG
jgi:phosphoglycolate phosphatase-like HAD superfamily hydrolase